MPQRPCRWAWCLFENGSAGRPARAPAALVVLCASTLRIGSDPAASGPDQPRGGGVRTPPALPGELTWMDHISSCRFFRDPGPAAPAKPANSPLLG